MSPEKAHKLWKMIQEAGDYLRGQSDTLPHTSYANNLKFIKNNSHKDSLRTPNKLETRLETFEINQIVE